MKPTSIRIIIAVIAVAIAVAIVLAVVLLSRDDGIDLSEDPRGQEACDALVTMVEYDGDTEIKMGSMLEAGKAAMKARTPEIRDTATSLADGVEGADALSEFATVDVEALTKVCEDAGVDIPER